MAFDPDTRRRRRTKQTGPNMESWTPAEKTAHRLKGLLETPLGNMALPVRIVNTLEDNNIILVKDLLKQSYETLMEMKNFGDKTLGDVKAAIQTLGLKAPEWKKPPKPKIIRNKNWAAMDDFW